MCGIFAALSLNEPFDQSDYKVFKDATDLVSHRGPDASGYRVFRFSEENKPGSFNLFFGHRRLSIIDLSADGNQPMEDDGVTIIYNGEIFNYIELREELVNRNVWFKTKSDTEVILKIYKHFGPEGFDKLNGMWAFILYDSKKKILVASRDRFSIKPLFWTQVGAKIYFASEIKQLLKFLPSVNLNNTLMTRLLLQGTLDLDELSFISGITKLQPKFNLIINLSSKEIIKQKYWDYKISEITENLIYEQFRHLLIDSIKIRLRSDVEVGVLLSGGLDSSVISVVGNGISENLRTFSVISEGEKYSEEKFIDLLVLEKKINNTKLRITSAEIKKNLDEVLYYQDEPFLGFIILAHYAILKKIKEETDIVVILNGQGGDEVLAGYLRFFFYYLKNLKQTNKYLLALKEIIASIIYRTVLLQVDLPGIIRYSPKMLEKGKNFLLVNEKLENTWEFSSLAESQIKCIDRITVPFINKYEDRNSMAHSLEIRLPFLDHRLVEFLLSIKPDYKIKNGWNKYILRKSFQELPHKIRWRRDKKGFILPEEIWLKNDFRNEILTLFNKSLLEEFGFINGKKFAEYYNRYLNNDKKIHSIDISRIYLAEKWLRKTFN